MSLAPGPQNRLGKDDERAQQRSFELTFIERDHKLSLEFETSLNRVVSAEVDLETMLRQVHSIL